MDFGPVLQNSFPAYLFVVQKSFPAYLHLIFKLLFCNGLVTCGKYLGFHILKKPEKADFTFSNGGKIGRHILKMWVFGLSHFENGTILGVTNIIACS